MSPPPKPPSPPDAKLDNSPEEAPSPLAHITPEIIAERPTLTSLTPGDSSLSGQLTRSAFAGLVLDGGRPFVRVGVDEVDGGRGRPALGQLGP